MSKDKAKRSTIGLSMIVKNEAHILRRCLESVLPYIDYWVISDTGSTDGTQDLIREIMQDVPGELIEREWKDFAHNRNQALLQAPDKCDYSLIIDADEWLEMDKGADFTNLTHDCYYITKVQGPQRYWVPNIIRNEMGWLWHGVIHECLKNNEAHTCDDFLAATIQVRQEGARALDPDTYRKDIAVLIKGLIDEPDNTRYQFYLAQSYRDIGDYELAITHYKRRAAMGGWDEEVFISKYQIAISMEHSNFNWQDCLAAHFEAWSHSPDRAEPLYRIGANYFDVENYPLAKLFLNQAARLPIPTDKLLFIEDEIYTYLAAYYAGLSAENLGDYAEAIEHFSQVVKNTENDSDRHEFSRQAILRCKQILEQNTSAAA